MPDIFFLNKGDRGNQKEYVGRNLRIIIIIIIYFFISALSRKPISVMSMLGVYLVLGVGMVVAFLVLIAEILWKRKMTKDGLTRVKFLKRRFVRSFLVTPFINL